MKFTVARQTLLKPLQAIISIADKKHTMAILSNILCQVSDNKLFLKASDLDTEVTAEIDVDLVSEEGTTVISARKLIEIIRHLSDDAQVNIESKDQKTIIKADKGRFLLSSMDPKGFPSMQHDLSKTSIQLPQSKLASLLKRVSFAMAHNDVRYFLNGMLWEISDTTFKVVATDGHRLAMSQIDIDSLPTDETQRIIVPRKAILELMKMLEEQSDELIAIRFGKQHFQAQLPQYIFTSKLIDGRYPDYMRVLPQGNNKQLIAQRDNLKQALVRTAILSNEKYRGVRLNIEPNLLRLAATNPEQEQANDEVEINYGFDPIEVGFNVSYLLDVINTLDSDEVTFNLGDDSTKSILIEEKGLCHSQYVVMPIRL
ncbi:DNA polymerase III subunit beta [Thiotrichales bacterium 19S11-10]|nr:DNA polymerase III subunit beta [Thiotrichales bacterium 19S11-10]MCF6806920.1 DNA polymerase III subunit beta [Thiotrichales bacterium 19S9-11]MCF6810889.1 DNA polymerase III subunit beta [Thiotrichales bacterium 19S9-12]